MMNDGVGLAADRSASAGRASRKRPVTAGSCFASTGRNVGVEMIGRAAQKSGQAGVDSLRIPESAHRDRGGRLSILDCLAISEIYRRRTDDVRPDGRRRVYSRGR